MERLDSNNNDDDRIGFREKPKNMGMNAIVLLEFFSAIFTFWDPRCRKILLINLSSKYSQFPVSKLDKYMLISDDRVYYDSFHHSNDKY